MCVVVSCLTNILQECINSESNLYVRRKSQKRIFQFSAGNFDGLNDDNVMQFIVGMQKKKNKKIWYKPLTDQQTWSSS